MSLNRGAASFRRCTGRMVSCIVFLVLTTVVCGTTSCSFNKCIVKNHGTGLILEQGKYDASVIHAAEFEPFDGKHPDEWHILLKLPLNVYMSHGGTIYETTTEIDGHEYKTYAAEFIVKKSIHFVHNMTGTPQAYLNMEKLQYEELTKETATGYRYTYGGRCQWTGGKQNWRLLEMTWYDERDLGDYSYGEIRITP
ncbi:hypothetical protein JW859_07320 [bacterium]|nr:hypothetical protein [bacterium]